MATKKNQLSKARLRTYIVLTIVGAAILYSVIHRLLNKNTKPVASPSPIITGATSARPHVSPSTSHTAGLPLINQPVLSPDLDTSAHIIYYYNDKTSRLEKFDLTTKQTASLSEQILLVRSISWSPNHQSALIEVDNDPTVTNSQFADPKLPDGYTILGLYDLKTKSYKRLSQAITAYTFMSDDTIIYQFHDERNNNLSISRPDGSGWKNITSLKGDAEIIHVAGGALVRELASKKANQYSIDGKLIKEIQLPDDLRLLQSQWRTDPLAAVYWVATAGQTTIKSFDSKTSDKIVLTLDTKPDQTSLLWDNKTGDIYLAGFEGLQKLDSKATAP